MRFDKQTPCKDVLASPPPTRVIRLPDGTTRTEKLCPIANNVKMVDLQGNVVSVPLANGYGQMRTDTQYATYIRSSKVAKGFLLYGKCPLTYVVSRRIVRSEDEDGVQHEEEIVEYGMPKDGPKDGACEGRFTRERCCKHVEKAIKARREVQRKHTEDLAERMMPSSEKLVQAISKHYAGDHVDEVGKSGKLKL